MAITTRLVALDRDVAVILAEDLSPAARSARLAAFAREQAADADRINAEAAGSPVPHRTFVDGAAGRPEEAVKPDGTIVYTWDLVNSDIREIMAMLVAASPRRSGRYAESHLLFADGVEVSPGMTPEDVGQFVIVSAVPYARKIERGESRQAPEGVYEAVAALASKRFGNRARIAFGWRSLAELGSSSLVTWARNRAPRPGERRQNAKTRFNRDVRNPAIVITFR